MRRLIEENAAIAQSDEAVLANATLSAQTLLATTVIELRIADANIDLAQQSVDAYRDALRVTQAQGTAGLTATPPSAVINAQVALETARSALIGLGVARAQYAHAIAVLAGKNPEDLRHSARQDNADTADSTGGRALDAAAAAARYRRCRTHHEGTECRDRHCRRGLLPDAVIVGGGRLSQSPLQGLLHTANHVWSIGASGTETVFDFGGRHAEVQAAKAAYRGGGRELSQHGAHRV